MTHRHSLVFLCGILLAVVPQFLRAADAVSGVPASSEASVSVPSVPPEVRSVVLSETAYGADDFLSGITPSVGTDRHVYVTGVIADSNGENTLATTSVTLYRTSVTSACSANKNNCYKTEVCALNTAYGLATEASYSCAVDIAYFADATDTGGRYASDSWTALVTTADAQAALATSSKVTEINSLLALDIPSNIAYGTLDLGSSTTAATNHEMVVTQKGNVRADVEVLGGAMTCSLMGSIPVANQRYSSLDTGYASSTGILSGTSTKAGINVVWQESDTVLATAPLYWNIAIPSEGVQGQCTGTNVIAVRAAANQGVLFDSQIIGATYTSKSYSGETDSEGRFLYTAGEAVTFSVGDVVIGTVVVPGDGYVFLQDIVGVSRTSYPDTRVVALARFVQSLDIDNNPNNKIYIPSGIKEKFTTKYNAQQLDDTTLAALVNQIYSGRKPTTKGQATKHLRESYGSFVK